MGNERREIAASIGKALIHPRLHSRSGMKSKESSTINVLEICVDDYESDLSEESKKKKKWVYRLFCVEPINITKIRNHVCEVVETVRSRESAVASLNAVQLVR